MNRLKLKYFDERYVSFIDDVRNFEWITLRFSQTKLTIFPDFFILNP